MEGHYHILFMDSERLLKNQKIVLAGAVEAAPDNLTDIDPADFIDPEEYGFKCLRIHE